jgi:hypothetical protein
MPDQDKRPQDQRGDVVAPGAIPGKSAVTPATGASCGDSGLRISRDGTWFYQGSPIARKPLVKLFASVLKREVDGQYYLVTPAETVPIAVDDAPFLAVAMEIEGSGKDMRLSFRTNLDELVSVGPEHPLTFRREKDGSFTPFILVRAGLDARIARPVYYELVAAAQKANGVTGIWSGGRFFPFPATESVA